MSFALVGPRTWSMGRDAEGHRTYKIKHLVKGTTSDGPYGALLTPGLPLPGANWSFGTDFDAWAWCRADATATPVIVNEPGRFFEVEQTFSTKPPEGKKGQRCQDNEVQDPLLEMPKVSGGFKTKTVEATKDRFDIKIMTSSHEMIRGPQNEWEESTSTVKIEQNVPSFYQAVALPAAMMGTLNAAPLWGMSKRCVRLASAQWEKKYYGQCYAFYSRSLEFELNPRTFDRDVLDEGTKALHGKFDSNGNWILTKINGADPDPSNPQHFSRFQDRNGNICRVVLDGNGLPAEISVGTASGHFVSVIDGNTDELGTIESWVNLNSLDLFDWAVDEFYTRGDLVQHNGNIYVAMADNTGSEPIPDPTFDFRNNWAWLENGLNDAGVFASGSTYAAGDFVSTTKTGVGSIHLEKYNESYFPLLGIPLTF